MVTILHDGAFDAFAERFLRAPCIVIPIPLDNHEHPKHQRLSLLYVRFSNTDDEFILPFDHSEAPLLSNPSQWYTLCAKDSFGFRYVTDRKALLHYLNLGSAFDVSLLHYMHANEQPTFEAHETCGHRVIRRNFPYKTALNRLVPIAKHIESCRAQSEDIKALVQQYNDTPLDRAFWFLNDTATNVFRALESVGVHVDAPLFEKHFGTQSMRNVDREGLTYTQYNLFTTTGRPSNRFAGVNYAAINKHDGSRSAFTSRHGSDGLMVHMDYDAYHLRLIADLIGYKFPPRNIHTVLGEMYFQTQNLTDEQYEESKRISFRQLYGGVEEQYKQVQFFQEVQRFIDSVWACYQRDGYITSPIGERKLRRENLAEMHPQKLFSYFVQLHETEQNVVTLDATLKLFEGRKSVMCLYTYDSVLIDFHLGDGADFLTTVKRSLESENRYPMKVMVGSSYNEMQNVTHRFR